MEPKETVVHVSDLVGINGVENARNSFVASLPTKLGVVANEVKIGLLEGEAHRDHELERRARVLHRAPEVIVDREVAQLDAELVHARAVEAEVLLLVEHGARETGAELRRRAGEAEKHERHELEREELVVGEEVERLAAELFGVEVRREVEGLPPCEVELSRAPRCARGFDRRAGLFVASLERSELVLERSAEQDALGEGSDGQLTKRTTGGSAAATPTRAGLRRPRWQ